MSPFVSQPEPTLPESPPLQSPGRLADEYVERFRPWLTADLETYLRVLASMLDEVELFAYDTDEYEGWTMLFNPDQAPAYALRYLAQFVGERLPIGIVEGAAREWIKDAPNRLRGTPYAIFRAAQRTLTGQRTVTIRERAGVGGTDDPERLIVNTYTSETPDADRVRADVESVIPADVILVFDVMDGQTWADVNATYASWAAVNTDHASWEAVRTTIPGGSTFTRPRSW